MSIRRFGKLCFTFALERLGLKFPGLGFERHGFLGQRLEFLLGGPWVDIGRVISPLIMGFN